MSASRKIKVHGKDGRDWMSACRKVAVAARAESRPSTRRKACNEQIADKMRKLKLRREGKKRKLVLCGRVESLPCQIFLETH